MHLVQRCSSSTIPSRKKVVSESGRESVTVSVPNWKCWIGRSLRWVWSETKSNASTISYLIITFKFLRFFGGGVHFPAKVQVYVVVFCFCFFFFLSFIFSLWSKLLWLFLSFPVIFTKQRERERERESGEGFICICQLFNLFPALTGHILIFFVLPLTFLKVCNLFIVTITLIFLIDTQIISPVFACTSFRKRIFPPNSQVVNMLKNI